MPSSRPATPATPASPKTFKIKDSQPGVPLFGCGKYRLLDDCSASSIYHLSLVLIEVSEHTQLLLSGGGVERMNRSIHNYKTCLRVIFTTPIVPQTSKTAKGNPFTTLTPNYLCLQCSATTTEQGRIEHGRETSHRFCMRSMHLKGAGRLIGGVDVESRSGCLYCQMCDDFVFDPTLEDLRLRKSGKGLSTQFHLCSRTMLIVAYSVARKRKLDDLFTDPIKEDPRFIATNTVEAPCRASGIRGIYNMGATCYMNVILQSFVHNPLLRNFYLGDGHQRADCAYENCMSCALDDMFQDFYAQETTTGYSASSILASFWLSKRKAYEELASNKEQDAHEFFQFLTEELHEINGGGRPTDDSEDSPVKKSKSDSDPDCKCVVHQTFYGKLQSTITCQSCGDINTSIESFLDLSLGLDVLSKKKSLKATALSLQKCLDEEYSRPERCEYSCRQCNTQEAKKQLSIKSLPNVLCIQLKVRKHFLLRVHIETKLVYRSTQSFPFIVIIS
jgi:ubiquitin carboxyl-terminal hydrolase 22/27/51